MAERKGLEPSASGVTGRRYNRLNYRSIMRKPIDATDSRKFQKSLVVTKARILAERKGLEPSASGVTGRRYNRLNYRSAIPVAQAQRKLNGQGKLVGGEGFEPPALGL